MAMRSSSRLTRGKLQEGDSKMNQVNEDLKVEQEDCKIKSIKDENTSDEVQENTSERNVVVNAEINTTKPESEVADSEVKEENIECEEDEDKEVSAEKAAIVEAANIANCEIAKLDYDSMDVDNILKLKVTLNDGSQNFLFSRGPKYADGRWPVNCHLCRLGNLFTDEHIKHHLKGRSHTTKLTRRPPHAKYYPEPFFQSVPKDCESEKPIKIYPGEIIEELHEEYADRIIRAEEFEVKQPEDKKLIRQLEREHLHEYNSRMPLMGLCYIYKMMGYRGVTYYCTLCNIKITEEAFQHIASSDHQFKYINRHFPKLYERINNDLKKYRGIDVRFCVRNVFRKLYRKIENIKGNRKLTICDDEDFFKNRKRYLLKTRFDEHYGEDSIIFTDQEIDVLKRKCINGMQFIKADLISLENPSLGIRLTYEDERAGEQITGIDRYDNYRRGGDIWDEYFQILDRECDDLNAEYRNYDRFPRRHPKYESEFGRYKKKDGSDKDKKEKDMPWNAYWRRRLRVLYDNELAKRKQRIKRSLGLRPNDRSPSPPPRGGLNNSMMYNQGYDGFGNQQAVAGLRDVMLAMMQSGGSVGPMYNAGNSYDSGSQSNEPLGVISVLRLFNALEGQLGSLGPTAVQLLAKAILVEKNNQNPNDLMIEKDFYVFFATAREKLKGQYYANMIPNNLIGPVRKTVQDTTTLMEMFEDYCKRTGKKIPNIDDSDSGRAWNSDNQEKFNINEPSGYTNMGFNSSSSGFDSASFGIGNNFADDFFIGGGNDAYSGSGGYNSNQQMNRGRNNF